MERDYLKLSLNVIAMVVFGGFLIFCMLHEFGCNKNIDWSTLGKQEESCASGALKGAISTAADEATTTIDDLINRGVLPDSQTAQDTWTNFAIKYGVSAAGCAVSHLVGDVFLAGPEQVCSVPHKHHVTYKHYSYLKFAREHISKRRK